MSNTPRRVNSVGNALRLLAVLAEHPDGLGVSDLATRLDVGKSTAHLLLSTLAEHGFVERLEAGTYRLGIAAFEVGSAVPESARFGGPLTSPMRKLADRSGEAVSLAIHRGLDALIVQRFESASILRAEIRIGTRMPVHSCGSGKVFLAELPVEELDALFPSETLPAVAKSTFRKKSALLRQLVEVRRDGHATIDEEYTDGVRGIATGVRNRRNEVVAALSVAGPIPRFEPSEWLRDLNSTVEEMSTILVGRL